MNTSELINSLSLNERNTFETQLHHEGKKRSLLIFKALANSEVEPSKEVLYSLIYEKPYCKKEDYLIRNEIRKLNNLIYDFMVKEMMWQEAEHNKFDYNIFLLKALYQRGLKKAFHKRMKLSQTLASKAQLLKYVSELNRLKFIASRDEVEFDKNGVPSYMNAVDEWLQSEIHSHYQRLKVAEYNYWNCAGEAIHEMGFAPARTVPDTILIEKFDEIQPKEVSARTKFWTHSAKAMEIRYRSLQQNTAMDEASFEKIITNFKKAIEEISNQEHDSFKALISNTRMMLAVQYFEQNLFDEGMYWVKLVIEDVNSPEQYRAVAKVNYLMALLRCEQPTKVIEAYYEVENTLNIFPTTAADSKLVLFYAYLILKKQDDAWANKPELDINNPRTYWSIRMAQVIIFLLDDEIELARNELRNVNKAIDFRKDSYLTFLKELIKLFDEYIKLLVSSRKEQKTLAPQFFEALSLYEKHHSTNMIDVTYFPVLWLKQHARQFDRQLV